MFVGRGLRPPNLSGLGLFEPTPTGIRFVSAPFCASPEEIAEANSKCVSSRVLHGIGQTTRAVAPMTGRLAAYSPCVVKDLPICPAPKCINEETATAILRCMAGGSVAGLDCREPKTAFYLMALSTLPYCSRPSFLPPAPDCLPAEQKKMLAYCGQYPNNSGPDKNLNAFCWGARHDAKYWDALLSRRTCAPPVIQERPPPRPPPAPPPVVVRPPPAPPPVRPPVIQERPPAPPPARPPPAAPPIVRERPPVMTPPEPPMYEPPEEDLPPEPERAESSMMGLWGILALVAVGGGGYYLYRRYKR